MANLYAKSHCFAGLIKKKNIPHLFGGFAQFHLLYVFKYHIRFLFPILCIFFRISTLLFIFIFKNEPPDLIERFWTFLKQHLRES